MANLLQQIKARRLSLNLKQNDMPLRIGISRQQYQRLESKGNPRLDTLELIAKGLSSEVMLIPQEKLQDVQRILNESTDDQEQHDDLSEDPWKGLLGDED